MVRERPLKSGIKHIKIIFSVLQAEEESLVSYCLFLFSLLTAFAALTALFSFCLASMYSSRFPSLWACSLAFLRCGVFFFKPGLSVVKFHHSSGGNTGLLTK